MENRSIHDDVWLAPWDPEWAREFHMEKQCIVGSMMAEEHSAFVRHVGSTAKEGMPAKPIIRWLPMIPIGMDWKKELPTNIHMVLES